MLLLALVLFAVVAPLMYPAAGVNVAASSVINLLLLLFYVLSVAGLARHMQPADASVYRDGALMLCIGVGTAAVLFTLFLPLGAREAMAAFAGIWIAFRLSRLRPQVEHSDIEE